MIDQALYIAEYIAFAACVFPQIPVTIEDPEVYNEITTVLIQEGYDPIPPPIRA